MAVALCVFGAAARSAADQQGKPANGSGCTKTGGRLELSKLSVSSVVASGDDRGRLEERGRPEYGVHPSLLLQAEVGQGTYGTVRTARDVETQQVVAVKIMPSKYRSIADREVEFLERVESAGGHENVVHFLRAERPEAAATRGDRAQADLAAGGVSKLVSRVASWTGAAMGAGSAATGTLLLFEYIKGCELFDRVVDYGPLPETDAVDLTRQTVRAVRFLHEDVGIVHADLKPENLLLGQNGKLKICDFGSAMSLSRTDNGEEVAATSQVVLPGTAAYCAPEVLDTRRKAPLTTALDVWSMGCVLYVMLSGVHPFDPRGNRSDAAVARAVQRDEVRFDDPVWRDVSDDAKDLLQRMLHKDPSLRLTLEQVENHPFLRRHA